MDTSAKMKCEFCDTTKPTGPALIADAPPPAGWVEMRLDGVSDGPWLLCHNCAQRTWEWIAQQAAR